LGEISPKEICLSGTGDLGKCFKKAPPEMQHILFFIIFLSQAPLASLEAGIMVYSGKIKI
jgi:hypothetical protein